jgi:hypothetical protein
MARVDSRNTSRSDAVHMLRVTRRVCFGSFASNAGFEARMPSISTASFSTFLRERCT